MPLSFLTINSFNCVNKTFNSEYSFYSLAYSIILLVFHPFKNAKNKALNHGIKSLFGRFQ